MYVILPAISHVFQAETDVYLGKSGQRRASAAYVLLHSHPFGICSVLERVSPTCHPQAGRQLTNRSVLRTLDLLDKLPEVPMLTLRCTVE